MKKLVVILLLVLYGFSSTGMTLHFHYCCGKLAKVELTPVKDTCGKEHKNSKKPCCDEKQLSLKVKADHKGEEAAKLLLAPATLPKSYSAFSATNPGQGRQLLPHLFAPPPLNSTPLFVLHCVYRI